MNDQEKIAQVLSDASVTITKLAEERDQLKSSYEKLASDHSALLMRLESEKVAAEIFEKGLDGGRAFTDVVDELEKAAREGELPVYEKAVKLASRDMGGQGFQINHDEASGSGTSELEQFLVG